MTVNIQENEDDGETNTRRLQKLQVKTNSIFYL